MTDYPKDYKDLSLAYDELTTRYSDLSTRFRTMRNTLSNKYQENILAELESKTHELQELTEKLNLNGDSAKKHESEANEGKIKQLENLIDFQKRRINGLERDRVAFQADIHSLTLELKEKQQLIDRLNEHRKSEGDITAKTTPKSGKHFLKHAKHKRASTVDVLMPPSHLDVHSKKHSGGKSNKFKGLEVNDSEKIQEELAFPLPRPRSPHPIFNPYPAPKFDGALSKSLPVSPTTPEEKKMNY